MSFLREAAARRVRRQRKQLRVAVAVVVICALPYVLIEGYRAYLRLDREWRFVEDVLLRPAPQGGSAMVIRWATPIGITLVNATAEDEIYSQTVVAAFTDVIAEGGISIRSAKGGGNAQLFFAPPDMFDRLADNFEASPHPPSTGFYLVWPNERFAAATAVAVVGANLSGTQRNAAIIHEIAHLLGLRGHSPAFPESVVFGDGEQLSVTTTLSPLDRKLLRLLYTRLEPADGWREVRTAYERYWGDS